MALNREQLKAKGSDAERRFEMVPLPTGGDVRIRSLKRSEQRAWRKSCQKKNGDTDQSKRGYFDDVLLSMSVVDDNGKQLFTVAEAFDGCWDDLEMADTAAILDAAGRINNITDADDSDDVVDAVKNSEETPESGTSGDSAESTE